MMELGYFSKMEMCVLIDNGHVELSWWLDGVDSENGWQLNLKINENFNSDSWN